MKLFYRIAYALGVAPWERGGRAAAPMVAAIFDRVAAARPGGPGRALDIGCGRGGWSVELGRRGWQVTGIDFVPGALKAAQARARAAGVPARFVRGDLTRLEQAGLPSGFDFLCDFGALHGLTPEGLRAAGRGLTTLAAPGAVLASMAFAPGRRGPGPRGLGRADYAAAFPDWEIVAEEPAPAMDLPGPLRGAAPVFWQLQRR